MKHLLKSTLIILLSFMSTTAAKAADNAYLLKCGDMSMVVDAEHGGKIMSLKYHDTEMLSQSRFPESFGSTFWTSPQKEWNWPPVPEFDKNVYRVLMAEPAADGSLSRLLIHSPTNARLGLSIGKEFSIDKRRGAFVVTYSIRNEGSAPRQVAPWEISRVTNTGDGLIFFQAVDDNVWPAGLLNFKSERKAMWYTPDENPQNRKVNADGRGWLAYCANGLVLLKAFPDMKAGEEAPGEAEIQVYVNRGKTYSELESQGAYVTLQPGGELSWTVRWYLFPVDAKSQQPKKLLKKVNKLLK